MMSEQITGKSFIFGAFGATGFVRLYVQSELDRRIVKLFTEAATLLIHSTLAILYAIMHRNLLVQPKKTNA